MPAFETDILESHRYVLRMAYELTRKGHDVLIPGLRVRPDVSQREAYRDGGDLRVKYGDQWRTVEVKHRKNIEFSSVHDYPYERVIVDACTSYDSKNPPPLMYVIINPAATACLLIDDKTRPLWQRVKKSLKDRAGGTYQRDFYTCPVSACRWERL